MCENILTLACALPIVIQSGEIQKVKTGIAFRIDKGYVLNISTHSGLSDRAGEIFPALITLDHIDHGVEGELMLPVRNNGRNPLNIMPGQIIARGYVSKVQKIEPYEFEGDVGPEPSKSKTKPQKKNPNFKFEVN